MRLLKWFSLFCNWSVIKRVITHKWTDGLMEGSAQDVTEDQKGQPLTFLQLSKHKGKSFRMKTNTIREHCYKHLINDLLSGHRQAVHVLMCVLQMFSHSHSHTQPRALPRPCRGCTPSHLWTGKERLTKVLQTKGLRRAEKIMLNVLDQFQVKL